MRHRRGIAVLVAACGLLAGCGTGSAVYNYGTVAKGSVGRTVEVRVTPGARFSLSVDANASVGDSWTLGALPDTKVASFISEEHKGDVVYFVFNAKSGGTADVVLTNCWRCGKDRVPLDEESRRLSGDATFTVITR